MAAASVGFRVYSCGEPPARRRTSSEEENLQRGGEPPARWRTSSKEEKLNDEGITGIIVQHLRTTTSSEKQRQTVDRRR
ncbi:uncharacterized protein V6R79_006967 [Siganus canaliculatus]